MGKGHVRYTRFSKNALGLLSEKRDAADECWTKQVHALTHRKGKKK